MLIRRSFERDKRMKHGPGARMIHPLRKLAMPKTPDDTALAHAADSQASPTMKARSHAALLKNGALQRAIFNSANFSSIATDAKGVIQIFNVGAERMLGYTAAEVMNKITPADISDPHELVARAQTLSAELETPIAPGFEALVFKASRGIEDIYELTYIRKDGSRFPAVVSVTALRDAQDAIIGYLLIGTDNTARKRAEDALLKAGALQRAIFNSANFSSIATDAKGVIQIFNVGAERMLGYTAADVMNKITPADISDPHELVARAQTLSAELGTPIAPGFEALVFKASRGIEDIYELTYIRKDGSRFPALVSVTALRDAQDMIIGYLLIGTDNTARKHAEEARRSSEALLDRIGIVAGVGGWELDLRTQTIAWSAQMYRIHEVDAAYRPHYEEMASFYPPDARRVIEDAMRQGIDRGTGWDLELPLVTAKGRKIWVRAIGMPQLEDGTATRLIGTLQDISARKHIEEARRASEARYRTLFEHAPEGIVIADHGFYIDANASICRMLGYTREELIGLNASDIEIRPATDRMAAESTPIEAEADYPREWQFRRKDGSVYAAEVIATTMPDGNLLTMIHDIAERKQIEDEKRALDQRLRDQQFYTRSLIESNIDALVTTDALGIITDVNKQMEDLTGRTRDELIGAPFKNYFTDPARAEAGIKLVLRQKKITNYELTARDGDGKETVVSFNATIFHDRDRKLQGVFVTACDITERKQYEESLRKATHKAERANRAKSEFLANMSHEIRTPMNAVIGLTYLLGQTSMTTQQTAFLAKLKFASKSLLAVLNNVLDLSKIEAGELIVERAPFNLPSLLAELSDMMAAQATAKGITFEIDAPDDLPASLSGDAGRVNQILINLISNAIKFTERGGVVLRVHHLAVTSNCATLCFVVRDTGIGIAQEMQARLFTPFAQADASITRRFGGTGLGLSIVKRLVSLMGGEVDMDSTPGVGSEFRVTLDFALAAPEAIAQSAIRPTPPSAQALSGVRILVVDDSDVNLDVTKQILELKGATVWLASNGQEAFEHLEAKPGTIDVVLMDVQMPILDGHDATRRIRLELKLADLPIIALTAGALSSERQRANAAGMDDYIVKPFEPHCLVSSILRHVVPASGQAQPPLMSPPKVPAHVVGSWPEIAGIDMSDARTRLSDDLGLFRTVLKRLLDEFSDVAIPPAIADRVTLSVHAARMHKLRGSAGLLGAKAIQKLAGDAEAACLAGEAGQAAQLMKGIAAQLQGLRRGSARLLKTTRAPIEVAAVPGDDAIEPRVLADLVHLLREQNLSAIERFSVMSPMLLRLLGKDLFDLVGDRMDNLRFDDAADTLEASLNLTPKSS
jgi:PAS domain S-box-containing protein